MLKWANVTAQKGNSYTRTIRSFKDPSLTTGTFLLDLLDGMKPGIVDPVLVINVNDTGDYEDRRQNGARQALVAQFLALISLQLNWQSQSQEK